MSKNEIFMQLMRNNQWEDFRNFACFTFLNRSYSVFNCALILLQRPGATIVKNENNWSKVGRFISPDATPLILMQPGGPVMLAYDYSDTYGEEPFPAYEYKQEYDTRRKVEISSEQYSKMIERLKRYGIAYSEKKFGERRYGQAAALESVQYTYYSAKKPKEQTVKVEAHFLITINSTLTPHEKALALFHELGHIYCGHLNGKRTKANCVPEFRSFIDPHVEEFEAEMTCKLICDRSNYYENCDEYLKSHMDNGCVPPYSKIDVFLAVDKIRRILGLY